MKMKKIISILAATTVACTAMAMSASAAGTTFNTDGEYLGDWTSPNFVVDDEGTIAPMISYDYLTEYVEDGCTITINFDYHMIAGESMEKYLVSVGNANGWAKLYGTDNSYVTGVPTVAEATTDGVDGNPDGSNAKKLADGTPVYDYMMKTDGFMVINNREINSVKFNLTGDAVQYLIDNPGENDDGTTWGGLIFQLYGLEISSVEIAPNENFELAAKSDDTGDKKEEPKDDNKSDDNTPTGSTAGLAFAGIALAGAAIVATKKIK